MCTRTHTCVCTHAHLTLASPPPQQRPHFLLFTPTPHIPMTFTHGRRGPQPFPHGWALPRPAAALTTLTGRDRQGQPPSKFSGNGRTSKTRSGWLLRGPAVTRQSPRGVRQAAEAPGPALTGKPPRTRRPRYTGQGSGGPAKQWRPGHPENTRHHVDSLAAGRGLTSAPAPQVGLLKTGDPTRRRGCHNCFVAPCLTKVHAVTHFHPYFIVTIFQHT